MELLLNEKDECNRIEIYNEYLKKIPDLLKQLDAVEKMYKKALLEEEMLKENLPYKVIGSINFYNRKEIKDLLAYLRLIHNSKDNVSLLRVINTPKRGIGLKTIESLTEKSDNEGISMYDAITSGKELEFKNIIEKLKNI